MGVMVSSSHIVAPCPSGGRLFTLFPCSKVRSLSRETVLHKLLQCKSFPQAAALHELPQHESLPWGAVLQKQAAAAWVHMASQALPTNLLQCGLLSPRVHRSWQKPAPAWAPHGVTAFFRHPPAPAWGPFHGLYRCTSAPPWTSMDRRRTTCLTLVFSTSCKGRLSALVSRAPPPPSFITDLRVYRVVSFTFSHSSLLTAVLPQVCFLPLLKYVITEALPLSLIGLALARCGCVLDLGLALALSDMGEASRSFSQKPPL